MALRRRFSLSGLTLVFKKSFYAVRVRNLESSALYYGRIVYDGRRISNLHIAGPRSAIGRAPDS